MNLGFDGIEPSAYTSASQLARVLTESWAEANLYCAACESNVLRPTPPNTRAVDFICDSCSEAYQLKSGRSKPGIRIVDAAYTAMIAAVRGDRTPNLLHLHYSLTTGVENLLLIPRFFFTEDCIEARSPLASTARRSGWVGCNIRLDRIAPEGRIDLVLARSATPRDAVRRRYQQLAPLANIPASVRGWALAVLLQVHRIGKREFALDEVYRAEQALSSQFPRNQNVRAKIRQQLQVLRDLGLLEFVGRGRYRLL